MPQFPDLPRLPHGLLADLRRDPTYALETFALTAVDVHGPAARDWVASRGPLRYKPRQLAGIAIKRTSNLARVEGAALGLGGFVTIAPDMAALAWMLTREVVFVAAAYGLDPTDRARVAEVLVICEVYETVAQAEAALAHQGERLAVALTRSQVSRHFGAKNRTAGSTLVRFATKRLARRWGGRLVPGLGALLGSIDNAAAARAVGKRAIAFYDGR